MKKMLAIFACACCGLVEAATYYKVGNDPANSSSFAGNVSSTVGWSTTKGATATSTVSDMANSDFIADGCSLRTPAVDPAVTFGGRSLTFTGGGYLMLKKANNGGDRHVTIKDLRVTGDGRVNTGQDLSQFTLEGNITLAEDAILSCNFGLSSTADDWRYLVLRSTLTGPASSQIAIRGSGVTTKTQSSLLQIENAADFLGTITDTGAVVRNFTLRLAGPFGGSITSLPSETTNVVVNIDGLDPDTGLRVLSTTIPAPLLTKLAFYSPTTDVFTAGRKLLTFPKDTVVDPAAFTIKAGWSLTTSTDATLLYLGVVTNADETVSLVTTQGPVLYKIGSDPANYTSFTTNYSSTVGWATTLDATATTPFSRDVFAAAECVIDSSSGQRTLRTPASVTSCWFLPHALRIKGGEVPSDLLMKSVNYAVVTIPNLISENGMVGNGISGYTYTLAGQVTIVDGKRFSVNVVDSGARTVRVESIVRGNVGTVLRTTGVTSGSGSGSAFFYDLSDFRGEFQNTAKNMTIDIAGTFAGTVGALSNDPTLRVNYDGLPASTGLRVTATAIPTTLKTKLRFYSTTQNFLTDGLPLLTFPAGTTVTPSDFTIQYCTTADGMASTFPALKVVTGTNNEVVLAVDCLTPQTARYQKGDDDAYAWHFYDANGSDVTATCGLTEPTASITVLVANTDELAALRALTYTAKATQLTSFEATADTDLRSDTLPLGTQSGAVIDLKGHRVDFPTNFFSGSISTTFNPIKNGTFEEDAMTAGCYVTMTPQSWTASGSPALIKNNASFAYNQQNSSNWCYLPNGSSISQTFYLPSTSSCTITFKYADKNWASKKYTSSTTALLVDGTSLMANKGTSSACIRKSLAAGKHTLTIKCTSGAGVNIDNVVLTAQVSSATVTDTVGGGELHVNVPEGTTVANPGIVLTGKLKFIKEGAGTFTSGRIHQTYTGGTEVVAGKLTTTAGTGSTTDFSAKYYTFGAQNSEIVVRAAGTFDIAGNYDYYLYHIILDGGILRSGSASDGAIDQPYAKWSWGGLGWITLTTNSTYYLRSQTVFHGGSAAHPINLGGYELTVDAPIDYKFMYWSTPITNGTLRLKGASKFVREYLEVIQAVDARTVDVIDAMGIKMDAMLSVRNYTPIRTWDNTNCTASASLNVYGTFRPDSPYFYGCTLQDGATLDLSGKTEVWSVKSAAKFGRTVVDFANNANIQLKLAGRKVMGQLVDWEANSPTNLTTLTFTIDPVKKAEGYRIYWNEKGIFSRCGMIMIVR